MLSILVVASDSSHLTYFWLNCHNLFFSLSFPFNLTYLHFNFLQKRTTTMTGKLEKLPYKENLSHVVLFILSQGSWIQENKRKVYNITHSWKISTDRSFSSILTNNLLKLNADFYFFKKGYNAIRCGYGLQFRWFWRRLATTIAY